MQNKRPLILAIVLGLTAATQLTGGGAEARSGRLFVPDHRSGDRGGEHFDNVMANYARRCAELDQQFVRERAGRPDSAGLREASALYDVGSAHCRGGAGLTAIDELSEAIKRIGGIPHTSF